MIHLPNGTCTGREGILESRSKSKPEWSTVAKLNGPNGPPYVCQCEHEAIRLRDSVMLGLISAMIGGEIDPVDMPNPIHDFRYTFVDEVPAALDKEPESVDEASALIAKITGKLS